MKMKFSLVYFGFAIQQVSAWTLLERNARNAIILEAQDYAINQTVNVENWSRKFTNQFDFARANFNSTVLTLAEKRVKVQDKLDNMRYYKGLCADVGVRLRQYIRQALGFEADDYIEALLNDNYDSEDQASMRDLFAANIRPTFNRSYLDPTDDGFVPSHYGRFLQLVVSVWRYKILMFQKQALVFQVQTLRNLLG